MPGEARAPLRSVAIVGNGTVGLSAAVAMRQALPYASITLVTCDCDPAAFADRASSSLPQSNAFYDRYGVHDAALFQRGGASHRLAVRFDDWSCDNTTGWHGYGAAVPDGVDQRSHLSLSAYIAAAGRFAYPADDLASPLSDLDYALRFNNAALQRLLATLAEQVRIQHAMTALRSVEIDADGSILCLLLADGSRVEADLYLDCSGPQALLVSAMPDRRRISWAGYLGCNRLLLPAMDGAPELSAVDSITALPFGWRNAEHGRDAKRTTLAYHADCGTQEEAAASAGFPAGEIIVFEPGRLAQGWTNNVVAIGDAAANYEPLHWINLAHAHAQIMLLIELLPGRCFSPLEQVQFNRRTAAMADCVRDFIALHYCGLAGLSGPFWHRTRKLERSDELQLTLSEFARRGRLPFLEDNILPRDAWLAAMATIGLQPGASARLLAASPAMLDNLTKSHRARSVGAIAQSLPYPDWLASYLRASS